MLQLENGLAHMHHAGAVAGGTGGGGGAGFGAGAVADVALFVRGDGDAFFAAGSGFFQRDFYAVADVFALIIGLARTTCAAKHLTENVSKIKTLRAAKAAAKSFKTAAAKTACAAAHALFKGGMTKLVVGSFLLRVG